MTSLAQNLWLIPTLPLLAACPAGAERRENLAHGVSRGFQVAAERSPRRGGRMKDQSGSLSFGMNANDPSRFLSPLPGLGALVRADPRLAPWADISRHSVASNQ